jgi:hypothetical protein
MEELKRDMRTLRTILRKYSIDPAQYTAVIPLHPAALPGIVRTGCITAPDVIDSIYGRDYIYEVYEREAMDKGLSF